jgi:hypothetical protein
VTGACLCWAIDNNVTRKVSGGDPLQIAAIKGLVAGSINIAVAVVVGAELPSLVTVLGSGAAGQSGPL